MMLPPINWLLHATCRDSNKGDGTGTVVVETSIMAPTRDDAVSLGRTRLAEMGYSVMYAHAVPASVQGASNLPALPAPPPAAPKAPAFHFEHQYFTNYRTPTRTGTAAWKEA
jgi:hypothetical protein